MDVRDFKDLMDLMDFVDAVDEGTRASARGRGVCGRTGRKGEVSRRQAREPNEKQGYLIEITELMVYISSKLIGGRFGLITLENTVDTKIGVGLERRITRTARIH